MPTIWVSENAEKLLEEMKAHEDESYSEAVIRLHEEMKIANEML